MSATQRDQDVESIAVMHTSANGPGAHSSARPFGLDAPSATAILIALGLLLGTVPFLLYPTWTLRLTILLAAAPVGARSLWRLVADRDRPAILAVCLVASLSASALLASSPRLSLIGWAGANYSVLIFAAVLLVWAFGRTLSERAVVALERAMVLGLLLNVVLAAVQIAFSVTGGAFNAFPGRASGFLSNPSYFASVMIGALGWAVVRCVGGVSRTSVALVAVMAFGVGLSGSRIALGLAVVVLATVVCVRRTVASLWASVATIVGFGCAWIMTTSAGTTLGRLDELGTRGSDGRVQIWRYGVAAWLDRPVFGWGVGAHSRAVQGRYTVAFLRSTPVDDSVQPWNDPHNIVMLLLVSGGLVGLLFAVGFAATALRKAHRAPLAAMVVLTAATWAVQPASLDSLPLAMLLLGAAGSTQLVEAAHSPKKQRTLFIAGVSCAMAACVLLLGPSIVMRQAVSQRDAAAAADAARWYPGDPVIADTVAGLYADVAQDDPIAADSMTEWSRSAIDREPTRPLWFSRDATRRMLIEDFDGARTSLDRALELQPLNIGALQARFYLGILTGDDRMRDESKAILCEIEPDTCGDE